MKNAYEIRGDVTAIIVNSPKYGRTEVLIDTLDLPKAQGLRGSWHVKWCRNINGFYCQCHETIDTYKYGSDMLHRRIMDAPIGMVIDHVNRNTLDNRRDNLRIVTQAENLQNRGKYKNNRSGFKGVDWNKAAGKWRARIAVNGKRMNLGYFDTQEEASKVVIEARMRWMPFSNEMEVANERQ